MALQIGANMVSKLRPWQEQQQEMKGLIGCMHCIQLWSTVHFAQCAQLCSVQSAQCRVVTVQLCSCAMYAVVNWSLGIKAYSHIAITDQWSATHHSPLSNCLLYTARKFLVSPTGFNCFTGLTSFILLTSFLIG